MGPRDGLRHASRTGQTITDTIAIPSNTPPITVEGCPELEAAVFDVYAPAATETSPAGYSPDLPLFVICVRGSSNYINKTFRAARDAVNHLLSVAALEQSKRFAEVERMRRDETRELRRILLDARMRPPVDVHESATLMSTAALTAQFPPLTVEGVVERRKVRANALAEATAKPKDPTPR